MDRAGVCAHPYAEARCFFSTQSDIYAKVSANVAVKNPDSANTTEYIYMLDVTVITTTGRVDPTTVAKMQYFLPAQRNKIHEYYIYTYTLT